MKWGSIHLLRVPPFLVMNGDTSLILNGDPRTSYNENASSWFSKQLGEKKTAQHGRKQYILFVSFDLE